jgi:hypothetical protein
MYNDDKTSLAFDSTTVFAVFYFGVERINSGKVKWRSHDGPMLVEL